MGHFGGPKLMRFFRYKSSKSVGQTSTTTQSVIVRVSTESSSDFLWSQSLKDIFDDILNLLQEDNDHKIGLTGIGGCGKTALAKQVAKTAMQMKLFDVVVFLYVSISPDIRRLQGQTADMLGLKLVEEDEASRAERIRQRIKYSERVLVVVDDIWKQMNLEEIGIPYNVKFIFTSRAHDLCLSMGCQNIFQLNAFSEDEAWKSFKMLAGINNASTHLFHLGKEIVKECKGLPLAINVVAKALRGKDIDEWKAVLQSMKASNSPQEEYIKDDIYSTLKLSYSNLKSNQAKLLFLVCCLFPEDYQIHMRDLVNIAIRMDLCGSQDNNDRVKSMVQVSVNKLIDCCLLMPSDTRDCVRVHDLLRDFGQHIGYAENPVTMAKYADCVKELVNNNKLHEDFESDADADGNDFSPSDVQFQDRTSLHMTQTESHTVVVEDHFPVAEGTLNPGEPITIPKPSGNMVDFGGLCSVDESFLPLLEEACARTPHLMKLHEGHSLIFWQCAFNCLGMVLFLMKNVTIKDMVQCVDELQKYWEDLKFMKLDLEWLSPAVERALSSTILLKEAYRIGDLQEQVNNWSAQATKLRVELSVLEDKVAAAQREIVLIQDKLNNLGISDVSNFFM
ncbi:probable disease resistance protein At4g27220 [Abrus precatorius]|uniref:Probable disease resistance protein At4g27220 n=1 Tax=Abrus precatorius TaxID=3816 RepID=A0A8B8JNM6_ABRPR|nr:probable disease resistance protein At4g27220 [Abrus precatorius]